MKLNRFFLAAGLLAAVAVRAEDARMPFVTVASGNQSGCAKRALMTVESEAEWKRIWSVHNKADAAPPKVDFSRQSVLALLAGSQPNQKLIQVAEIVPGPRETLVFYVLADEDVSWEKALSAGGSQPFFFAVIDKPKLPLRFVDALIGDQQCSRCRTK